MNQNIRSRLQKIEDILLKFREARNRDDSGFTQRLKSILELMELGSLTVEGLSEKDSEVVLFAADEANKRVKVGRMHPGETRWVTEEDRQRQYEAVRAAIESEIQGFHRMK